jgi:hypothetical protein
VCTVKYVARTVKYVARTVKYVARTVKYVARSVKHVVRTEKYAVRTDKYVVRTDKYVVRTVKFVVHTVIFPKVRLQAGTACPLATSNLPCRLLSMLYFERLKEAHSCPRRGLDSPTTFSSTFCHDLAVGADSTPDRFSIASFTIGSIASVP